MGAIPEAYVTLALYVAFGVYSVMGFVFFIMGCVYLSDVGAVGTTGVYLLLLGLAMLVVGGLAILANHKKMWVMLFVVECVNVGLFLVRGLTLFR